jgi:hypothetical protein
MNIANNLLDRVLIIFSIVLVSCLSVRNFFPDNQQTSKLVRGVPLHTPTLYADDLIYNDERNTVPIVNEEYKVIFFQVAKAASSEWLRFFAKLQGLSTYCDNPHLHDNKTNGIKRLCDFSTEEAQRMMLDPTWTKAIFVRNPKTRILSAYLDKSVVHHGYFEKHQCVSYAKMMGSKGNISKKALRECQEKHEDFGFFLKTLVPVLKDNVHWRTAHSRVDSKWWPYIDYISNMENLSEDAEHFLRYIKSTVDGVSAWDRIGYTGWSDNERSCDSIGDKAFLQKRDTHHQTNAGDKLRQYYTPELERFVEEFYHKDFHNDYFHFKPLEIYPEEEEEESG